VPSDVALIFLFLAVFLPLKGRARIRKLLAKPQATSAKRLFLYASTIAFQRTATSVVAWRCWARGLSAHDLGLTLSDAPRTLYSAVLGAGFLFALQWLNLRRMAAFASQSPGSLFAMPHLYQGTAGFASSFILGILLGVARITSRSLIPSMTWDFSVDIAAGLAGQRYAINIE